jgi:hypothetical protein
MAMDKASKACGLSKQMSILDDKVSSLMAKIVHHEECDSYGVSIIESVCEMLRCKVPYDFSFFPLVSLLLCDAICCRRYLSGLCY